MSRRSTLQHLAAEIQHLKHALANLEQMRPPKSSPSDYAERGNDQAFAYTRLIRGARMNTQAEIFYLAVWRSNAELTNLEAAKHYAKLSEEPAGKFDEAVYRFQAQLNMRYLDLDLLPEEEIEASPWAQPLQISDNHVIMALRHDRLAEAFPLILEMAAAYGLVCFDPQNTKVHLPQPEPGRIETRKGERVKRHRMTKRMWIEIAVGLTVLLAISWFAGPEPTDKGFPFPLH